MTEQPAEFRKRDLATSVYLPSLLFAMGRGAVIPVLALLALELGASPAMAAVIVALSGLGTMVFDIPAGVLVAKLGDKRAMVLATIALVAIAVTIALRINLVVYACLVVLMGAAWSVWTLARLSYATDVTPIHHRGRVMSLLGGTGRLGQLIGPAIGGASTIPLGLAGPFLVQALLTAGALVALHLSIAAPVPGGAPVGGETLRGVLKANRRILATAGFFALTAQMLRSSRQVIIPLWGDHIGIGASEISFIFSASAAIESVFFYPVGLLMDRKGRRWAAIPSMTLLAVAVAAVPLASGLGSLTVVGLIIGLANGFGSGINMTLGSDLSPVEGRSQFFGLWRLVTDVGTTGGPLVVAAATSLVSLAAAPAAIGLFGLLGVLMYLFAVPETLAESVDRSG